MKAFARFSLIMLILAVGYAWGQSTLPAPPDVLTSQAAAAKALTDYKAWLESQLTTIWTSQQADEAKLSSLSDQSAAVATLQQQMQQLQQQLAADEARIKALEDAITSLKSKVASAGNTLATP
jgi:peptidoglycan hydrolase CwlO-like protein